MTSDSLSYLYPGIGSLALGGVIGVAAGYALKKLLKIGVFILGCFFGGLAWLSYKGLVRVNWDIIANQTQAGLTNTVTQVSAVMNHTASQLQHSGAAGVTMGNLLPVTVIGGFLPGFAYGLMKG
jgi:uncharacterized membrane protein (Fun14 family)